MSFGISTLIKFSSELRMYISVAASLLRRMKVHFGLKWSRSNLFSSFLKCHFDLNILPSASNSALIPFWTLPYLFPIYKLINSALSSATLMWLPQEIFNKNKHGEWRRQESKWNLTPEQTTKLEYLYKLTSGCKLNSWPDSSVGYNVWTQFSGRDFKPCQLYLLQRRILQ